MIKANVLCHSIGIIIQDLLILRIDGDVQYKKTLILNCFPLYELLGGKNGLPKIRLEYC